MLPLPAKTLALLPLLAWACGGGKDSSIPPSTAPSATTGSTTEDDHTGDTAFSFGPQPTNFSGTLIITGPTAGETVVGPNVEVTFEVNGCTVTPPSADRDECHIHMLVNNAAPTPEQGDYGVYAPTPITVTLDPGTHEVELQLIKNDGSDQPFEPLIFDEVTFTVVEEGTDTATFDTGDTASPPTGTDTGPRDTGPSPTDTGATPTDTGTPLPSSFDLTLSGSGFLAAEGQSIFAHVLDGTTVLSAVGSVVTAGSFHFAWPSLLDGDPVTVDYFIDLDGDGDCSFADMAWRQEVPAHTRDVELAASPTDPVSIDACAAF